MSAGNGHGYDDYISKQCLTRRFSVRAKGSFAPADKFSSLCRPLDRKTTTIYPVALSPLLPTQLNAISITNIETSVPSHTSHSSLQTLVTSGRERAPSHPRRRRVDPSPSPSPALNPNATSRLASRRRTPTPSSNSTSRTSSQAPPPATVTSNVSVTNSSFPSSLPSPSSSSSVSYHLDRPSSRFQLDHAQSPFHANSTSSALVPQSHQPLPYHSASNYSNHPSTSASTSITTTSLGPIHPGMFSQPAVSSIPPYAQYAPPPQSFSQSHNQAHQSPAPMHQQVNGLLVSNLGAAGSIGNGAHSSPPPQRAGTEDTVHWQQQLVKLSACRQASAPHHRARAAAITGRMNNNKSAISIQDPNRPGSTKPPGHPLHKKESSLSVLADDSDGDMTSPRPSSARPGSAAGHPSSLLGPSTPPHRFAVENSSVAANSAVVSPAWNGLDLGGMHLKALSPALFMFQHITSLYINYNALTVLPPSIASLRKLTILDVSGNHLTAVPPELGMITSLKEVYLFDNQLANLPPELGTLHQLDFLGLAGNPLPEAIRLMLEKEGTQALITFLRDSCPVPMPPPDREWITVEAESEMALAVSQAAEPETFTLLCYNILCHRYAPPQTYGYTPSWALSWDYRKELILQEVMGCGADFICLQEVDDDQYHDSFLPNLTKEGYDGAFFPKTRARTMRTDEKRHVDGCVTFWKTSKYDLVEKRVIEFNQVALQRPDMRNSDDVFNRVMSFDNIAVVCLLENPTTGSRLIIANVHMHWDPTFRDVKLVQAAMLVEEMEKVSDQFAKFPPKLLADNKRGPSYSDASKIPLIICGDFNSVPSSGVYEFLSSGDVAKDHEDFMDHLYGSYTSEGLSHKLNLKSAYGSVGELPMTNYTPNFEGAIDYIWYTQGSLAVTSLLGEVDQSYLSKVVGFPNAHFPSDHVPIFADFKIKAPPPSTRAVVYNTDR
ncbi:glucose-repressible alcohol dehydrogenase transcriptional effector [Phaffia rhodozyma]|uniref:CCR4-Not complex 3'-5'-exoribonuclease subunit Ccr4 n=1 Tax=Phaffia rhodozyma TaxID=264483 RepID=A0A0F7SGT1_PHARH|nr:glucose-repressible alcohol dehydrogenase transcriptional effector [Phaffia rhodozyma]